MVNKYGNDFLNNIMNNKEYPFIPEITNIDGFTIHEQDIVDFYCGGPKPNDEIKLYAGRVYKIYNKDHIWIRYYSHKKHIEDFDVMADVLLPHTSNLPYPPNEVDSINNGQIDELESFLTTVYRLLYYDELTFVGDWICLDKKYEKKRLLEVARIKKTLKKRQKDKC